MLVVLRWIRTNLIVECFDSLHSVVFSGSRVAVNIYRCLLSNRFGACMLDVWWDGGDCQYGAAPENDTGEERRHLPPTAGTACGAGRATLTYTVYGHIDHIIIKNYSRSGAVVTRDDLYFPVQATNKYTDSISNIINITYPYKYLHWVDIHYVWHETDLRRGNKTSRCMTRSSNILNLLLWFHMGYIVMSESDLRVCSSAWACWTCFLKTSEQRSVSWRI